MISWSFAPSAASSSSRPPSSPLISVGLPRCVIPVAAKYAKVGDSQGVVRTAGLMTPERPVMDNEDACRELPAAHRRWQYVETRHYQGRDVQEWEAKCHFLSRSKGPFEKLSSPS